MNSTKVLTRDTVSQRVRGVEYAVRGPLVTKALQYDKTTRTEPNHTLPFSRVTFCNIGNPQQLGQKPLTFIRQVIALVEYPELMDKGLDSIFPADVVTRAKRALGGVLSTGAYSESQGREFIREDVAAFINERDGFPRDDYTYSSPANIFLHDGASVAVQNILRLITRDQADGILVPIPQYPLYSATIWLLGGTLLPYHLNEPTNWSLSIQALQATVEQAKEIGVTPRALVVINPGNPTGACLDPANMEAIIEFCWKERIVILADEVYQDNIYFPQQKPFYSFKKIVRNMPAPMNSVELFSFHSTSKGFIGECGHRAGYVEMTNISDEVKQEYLKLVSINLCANISGQIVLSLMVNPPRQGDPSYALYVQERDAILDSLKRRAKLVSDSLNMMEGISCCTAEGALYAFPKITLPPKAIEEAQMKKVQPDFLYCSELLDATGLCVVPGSGFGQVEGEYHFRTTILPQEEQLTDVLSKFAEFHRGFINKYRTNSNV